ncbi:MAG TPA: hypothetical protein VND65_11335 [Candidatus Binatia bacterium]|nr:hypothetical protein [Candidatus Binatia bacterium]
MTIPTANRAQVPSGQLVFGDFQTTCSSGSNGYQLNQGFVAFFFVIVVIASGNN